jgi:hypothetical protein
LGTFSAKMGLFGARGEGGGGQGGLAGASYGWAEIKIHSRLGGAKWR